MAERHPTTPSPKLVGDWLTEAADLRLLTPANLDYLATRAAQWGADQELDACCAQLEEQGYSVTQYLRAARRPKPLTPAEKALVQYDRFIDMVKDSGCTPAGCIRDALKRLAELEAKQ